MKAPLVPLEGLMVPERKNYESTCLKMTMSPKQTFDFYLLSGKDDTFV